MCRGGGGGRAEGSRRAKAGWGKRKLCSKLEGEGMKWQGMAEW